MSLALRHRSNQDPNSSYAVVGGAAAGRGWTHSQVFAIDGGVEMTETVAGNASTFWYGLLDNGGNYSWTRRPGTRVDLAGTQYGLDVTDPMTKTVRHYGTHIVSNGTTLDFYITTIKDTYNKTVTYTYTDLGSLRVLANITDAAGRIAYFSYKTVAGQTLLSQVILHTASGDRQWDFIADSSGYLGKIQFPKFASSDSTNPSISFNYDGSGNITDIFDLRGSRWHYGYATYSDYTTFNAPRLVCSGVYRPNLTAPTTWDTLTSRATLLSWSATGSGSTGTRTCVISEPYGNEFNGANPLTASTRTIKHTYTLDAASWFATPITKVESPKPSTGFYSELFVWDYTDNTLKNYTDRNGGVYSFTYSTDNYGRLFTRTDPAGYILSNTWTNNLLTEERAPRDASGGIRKTTFSYNTTTRKLNYKILDPDSIALKTNYTYNTDGEVSEVWNSTGTNPADAKTLYEYDAYGNVKQNYHPGGQDYDLHLRRFQQQEDRIAAIADWHDHFCL